jgi:hypothetical protein
LAPHWRSQFETGTDPVPETSTDANQRTLQERSIYTFVCRDMIQRAPLLPKNDRLRQRAEPCATKPLRSSCLFMSVQSTETLYGSPTLTFFTQWIGTESESDEEVSNKGLTLFPKYGQDRKSFSLPRSRRQSISDNSYLVSQVGDVVPIQFYRFQLYVSVDSAVTQSVTRYTVTVRKLHQNGLEQSRTVLYRRYSEFRKLYNQLRKEMPESLADCPEFPSLHPLRRFDPMVIQTRVHQLDQFMKFLVLHSKLVHTQPVQQFLGLVQ